MNERRQRLEQCIRGVSSDRPPVALWQHWGGDDQRPADLARALFAFQKQWNFDFIVVAPANTYSVADYGLSNDWRGDVDGRHRILHPLIQRSLDWTELRRLDPHKGNLAQSLEVLRLLAENYGGEVPLVQLVYSPLAQAEMLAGGEQLLGQLRTERERLKTGLSILTENLLRYMEALAKMEISGLLYHMSLADYVMMSMAEYTEFGAFYDQKLLEAAPTNWWLKIAHLSGKIPMLELAVQYPLQVLSWETPWAVRTLADGLNLFRGAVWGGIAPQPWMQTGMPGQVREHVRAAWEQTGGLRQIVGTGSPLMMTTPRANIRALRQLVEEKTSS
jgi:uroporphyrinogen decarboxylase